ncbi:MAG: M1 family metallopeptidase [Gammaproteobacteria bacterium]|jgi:leukotriene-A4 hydrolase|nr:M1 family metallopeptidase [Gammaproteobacteria bacterium]
MHKITIRILVSLLLVSLATQTPATTTGSDPHSYAQPQLMRIQHIHLDLDVDFAQQQLIGSAELQLQRLQQQADELVLDTRDLDIRKVEFEQDGQWHSTPFKLAPADPILGSALSIKLPAAAQKVRIFYATSPQASGLQWLTPAQTAGKRKPFMFSQSQAIHARSWVPLQDTPLVRFTFDANLRTPEGLKAVMGAKNDAADQDGNYAFDMPQPIPSYLLAIAAGELHFQAMSERTGVYAESVILAAAAAEFDDTEAMIKATEKRFGAYRWERYDLLILPPSFPFGGMENPRLSFITPTVIAGDKSLTSLIAHELAHSWSGNLVTNATWADLWLNEGFTTYLERRIVEDVYSSRRADMEAVLGYRDLQADLAKLDAADTRLQPDLSGRDPDEIFSSIAYEKGSLLLRWLEHTIGRAAFDTWLRGYFDRNAFVPMTSAGFLRDINQHLLQQHDQVTLAQVRAWIEQPGLPADATLPQSDAFAVIDHARQQWLQQEISADALPTAAWSTQEWLYFLNKLPRDIGVKRMTELDQAYHFTASGNNEILHSWLLLAIANEYVSANARLRNYLTSIGRRKLIIPLYEALLETASGRAMATSIYTMARPGYHPLAQATVDKLLASTAAE